MKVHYDKSEDILMIQLARKKIDDAFEAKNMIVHVTVDNEPVLLEIFNASKFFKTTSKAFPREIKKQILAA